MPGTGLAVLAHPLGDGLLVTPRDQRVDQAVAAGSGDVGVVEPVTAPVVYVVGQPEVGRHVLSGDVAGLRGIGFEDHTLFGRQQRAGTQDLAGGGGGFGVTR